MWNKFKQLNIQSLLWLFLTVFLAIIILKQVNLWSTLTEVMKAILPLFFSLIFVFLFEPLINVIKLKRFISCTLVYFGFLALLSLIIWFVIPVGVEQFQFIAHNLSTIFSQIGKMESMSMMRQFGIDTPQLMKQSYTMALSTTLSVVKGLSQVSIAYVAAYFISMDIDYFITQAKKHLPHYESWARFYKTSSQVVFFYCIGISLDMLFLLVALSTVLLSFNFPNAIFFGLMLALFNLLPYIGPLLGQVILVLVGLISYKEFPWLLFILVWLIQQIEANWVQPLIFKKVMNLRPILTLATLLVSGAIFGMVGIILSPIIAAIIQLGFRSYQYAKTSKTVGTWQNIWYNFEDFKSDEEEE